MYYVTCSLEVFFGKSQNTMHLHFCFFNSSSTTFVESWQISNLEKILFRN